MGRKDKLMPLDSTAVLPIGMQLRYMRQQKKLSLTAMAARLAYSKGYLSGLENGNIRVSEELIRRYERALELEPGELDELVQTLRRLEPPARQQPWYLPQQRNIFFTGREELLATIHQRLTHGNIRSRILAITGLGGIGKSQLACEYAYRYRHEYRAVLWLNAVSSQALITSCVELANYLDLPEKSAQDQQTTVRIVERWLRENPGCLLILDNVEQPARLHGFLSEVGNSHILLTTRMQSMGTLAQTLELSELSLEESMLLLLHRAKIIPLAAPLAEVTEATVHLTSSIAITMGGLPLALNQAAAYIEETGCGLSGYLQLIQEQQARLLKEHSQASNDYHTSVAATWTLSFEKIRQANPLAVDLLYLCAFLHPDQIYEEFIMAGAPAASFALQSLATNPIALHRAIGELRKYSLVRTDAASGALSIHRLVQVVILDALTPEELQQWVNWVVGVVNLAFPLVTVARWHETWSICQRYHQQVDACIRLIEQWQLVSVEAAQLLHKTGKYLEERTHFHRAERMYQAALTLDRQLPGPNQHAIVADLSSLARLAERLQHYEQAETYYRQALLIQDQANGTADLDAALVKDYIGLLRKMERPGEAAAWHQRVSTTSQQLRPQTTLTRTTVNDDDPSIHYSTLQTWETQQHPADFNNDAHMTSTPGASFQYLFTGIGIEIIADTSSVHGEVEIYLDNDYVQTLNTARLSNQFTQTIIFSKTDLMTGIHTLKLVLVRGTFILDALAVYSNDA